MATAQDKNIEVDPAVLEDQEEEGYASSGYDTSTASLSSSVNEYVFENGRRYHTYFGVDKNPMPTDQVEQERLDLHHEIIIRMLGNRFHKAPIGNNPQRILDIGTGTGIWAIDVADRYPSAEVIGTDLSPIQPGWVPPNCRFEVDDVEMEWTYRPESFDFVHARNVAQGISNWPQLMKEIYSAVKPGGYVELAETSADVYSDDGTLTDDSPVKHFFDLITKGMTSVNKPPITKDTLRKRLEDAGFVDIHVHEYKQILGPWPKDTKLKQIGAMMLLMCDTAFHAYGMAVFTRILKMSPEDANDVCNKAFQAIRNKNFHCYTPYHLVYGRKPE